MIYVAALQELATPFRGIKDEEEGKEEKDNCLRKKAASRRK